VDHAHEPDESSGFLEIKLLVPDGCIMASILLVHSRLSWWSLCPSLWVGPLLPFSRRGPSLISDTSTSWVAVKSCDGQF
jgi:hypothetical protein